MHQRVCLELRRWFWLRVGQRGFLEPDRWVSLQAGQWVRLKVEQRGFLEVGRWVCLEVEQQLFLVEVGRWGIQVTVTVTIAGVTTDVGTQAVVITAARMATSDVTTTIAAIIGTHTVSGSSVLGSMDILTGTRTITLTLTRTTTTITATILITITASRPILEIQ